MRKTYIWLGKVLYPILLPIMRPVLKRTKRVYVAVIYEKQAILIKNWLARDTWRFPGGGIGRGESPEDAALREVKEELRLVIQRQKLILVDEGVMGTDKLGYPYAVYAYVLDTYPRRLEDQYEIVDYGMFASVPAGTQPEAEATLRILRQRKLL